MQPSHEHSVGKLVLVAFAAHLRTKINALSNLIVNDKRVNFKADP